MGLCQIIFAILLPPVGVFMAGGSCSAVIINILLTCLGWIPGVIHALYYGCAPRGVAAKRF